MRPLRRKRTNSRFAAAAVAAQQWTSLAEPRNLYCSAPLVCLAKAMRMMHRIMAVTCAVPAVLRARLWFMIDISMCGLHVIRQLRWLSGIKPGSERYLRELTHHSNVGEARREFAKSIGEVLRDDPADAADSVRSYVALRCMSCASGSI